MIIIAHFAMLLLVQHKDSVSCTVHGKQLETITAAVGEALVLNCTYNCSSGFLHGHWERVPECSQCPGIMKSEHVSNGDLCTLPLYFRHLSLEDIRYNYTCFTEDRENEKLPLNTERLVSLQKQAQPRAQTTKVTADLSVTVLPNHEDITISDGFTGVKLLAAITVMVAVVLAFVAVYLCMSRNQYVKGKSAVGQRTKEGSAVARQTSTGTFPTNCERVAVRITPADCQSDQEVPYADIMITVRGSSTPELTQISYLSPGDHRERWREETGPSPAARAHLQASRSADLLHVHPREVSRKMSTSSEYAIITYS
ncbi:hypothetical protein DPEC_G00300740 [Dallia pectoralis]|uniref:Uncharacterized protein n=1 Tax=Dallia pectoralis TaxID=75939 RepID=A0ACC2FGJ5_DALPE|nr:hypothetical protein DPEC_G00300740 [Dallia pectoralis]